MVDRFETAPQVSILPMPYTRDPARGGEGCSVTPDLCTLNVDIRTPPAFDTAAAAHLLERLVTAVDAR